MRIEELRQKWESIVNDGSAPYKSLLVSADCIPELFLALEISGMRCMILQVPKNVKVNCNDTILENLSLEWHEETRFIIVGLRNKYFIDLFNDLVLSLYNRVKGLTNPAVYTEEFIQAFDKWAEFFSDTFSSQLSEEQVKGLFGELVVLKHFLSGIPTSFDVDKYLDAWQGPFDRTHDFIFSDYNIEVKTKDAEQVAVRISSEHQLQAEVSKALQLAVVDVQRVENGITLEMLTQNIKEIIRSKGGRITTFLKTLSKAGLGNAIPYNHLHWQPLKISFYDCSSETEFPKIVSANLNKAINHVKYNLTITLLEDFLIKQLVF
ncbi:PD-(D/E)XK motif protein [Chitinophagaceae bacterium MMS25-I14]